MGRETPVSDQTPSSRGFLKVGPETGSHLSSGERAALIRRGNQFFNEGKYETAKRVFLTCRYSDGLIRLAQRHMESNEPLEAFRLYWLAGDSARVSELAERMALVLRSWIEEQDVHAQSQ